MKNIAVQLWTVRSLCADAKGLASTLSALRSIGYTAVELAGLANVPAEEVRRILDDTGVTACAVHVDSQQLLSDPGAAAKRLATLGCMSAVYPYPSNQDFATAEGVSRLCQQLSSTGKVLASNGISFSYHNHSLELQRVGGQTVLEAILDQTDPKLVHVELDTYWLQAGGVDPIRWIKRCGKRGPLLHIKDYGVDSAGKPVSEEIGAGNFDWGSLFGAAKKAGVQWYIVEQDDHWMNGDPLESLRASWKYLSQR